MSQAHHTSVCICTYKRAELLTRLLSKLEIQNTSNFFDFSIVVVDNDNCQSAKQAVESFELALLNTIREKRDPGTNLEALPSDKGFPCRGKAGHVHVASNDFE